MLINLSSLTSPSTLYDYTITIDLDDDDILTVDISHPTKPLYSITFYPDDEYYQNCNLSHYVIDYNHVTQDIEVVYILQSTDEINDYLEHIGYN